jgi:hypothetical protein
MIFGCSVLVHISRTARISFSTSSLVWLPKGRISFRANSYFESGGTCANTCFNLLSYIYKVMSATAKPKLRYFMDFPKSSPVDQGDMSELPIPPNRVVSLARAVGATKESRHANNVPILSDSGVVYNGFDIARERSVQVVASLYFSLCTMQAKRRRGRSPVRTTPLINALRGPRQIVVDRELLRPCHPSKLQTTRRQSQLHQTDHMPHPSKQSCIHVMQTRAETSNAAPPNRGLGK